MCQVACGARWERQESSSWAAELMGLNPLGGHPDTAPTPQMWRRRHKGIWSWSGAHDKAGSGFCPVCLCPVCRASSWGPCHTELARLPPPAQTRAFSKAPHRRDFSTRRALAPMWLFGPLEPHGMGSTTVYPVSPRVSKSGCQLTSAADHQLAPLPPWSRLWSTPSYCSCVADAFLFFVAGF